MSVMFELWLENKIAGITWVDMFKHAAANKKGSFLFILAVPENT